MHIFEHIPIAILNNLAIMGFAWLLFKLLTFNLKLDASALFLIECLILFSSTLLFLLDLFFINTHYFFSNHYINQSFNIFELEKSNNVLSFIGIVYFFTIFGLLIKMLIQFNNLKVLKLQSDFSFSEKYKKLLLNSSIHLPENLKIGLSERIATPMVFGVFESVILFPISLCNHLSAEETKYILLHELAHILRKDYLINIFIEISSVLLCFNPFSYLIINDIRFQREIDCENIVITTTNNPLNYSKVLYNIAKFNTIETHQLSIAAIGNKNDLLRRIQKMNGIESSFNYLIIKAGILFIFTLILFLSFNFSNHSTKLKLTSRVVLLNQLNKTNEIKSISKNKVIKPFVAHEIHKKRSLNTNKHTVQDNLLAIENNMNLKSDKATNETLLSYADMLNQTRKWLKNHQSQVSFAKYDFTDINSDSIENYVANKLLLASIVKSYQLKKEILEKQLSKAKNFNEANDYLLNSKEWNEFMQYEKWIQEFLNTAQ